MVVQCVEHELWKSKGCFNNQSKITNLEHSFLFGSIFKLISSSTWLAPSSDILYIPDQASSIQTTRTTGFTKPFFSFGLRQHVTFYRSIPYRYTFLTNAWPPATPFPTPITITPPPWPRPTGLVWYVTLTYSTLPFLKTYLSLTWPGEWLKPVFH